MKTSEILIVPKMSKLQYDMKRLGMSEKEIREFYKKERVNADKIIESHERQLAGFNRVLEIFQGADVSERDKLTKDFVRKYKLVVTFGGDNHFLFVAQFVDDGLILGVNSDYERSDGSLTSINSIELGKAIKLILDEKHLIEEWPRLEIAINGVKIDEKSVSEIFIGEGERCYMSRHVIKLGKESEEHKGSGLIISTGAGSGGWYNSASRYLFPNGNSFPKTSKEARFILSEPFNGRLRPKYNLFNGSIKEDDVLEIISLSDSQAILSIDSLKKIKLEEGSKIKINISNPLRVMRFSEDDLR